MTPPQRLWHVEWVDFHERHQERRYRSAHRAAMQVASVLACPDEIARLKGAWLSVGGTDGGNIDWQSLDPMTMLREDEDERAALAVDPDAEDGLDLSALTRYERLRDAWHEYERRSA